MTEGFIGQSLTQEQLQAQVDLVDLLLCMYSGEDEISMPEISERCYESLKTDIDQGVSLCTRGNARIILHLKVPITQSVPTDHFIMYINIPLINQSVGDPMGPILSIMRPTFLLKKQFDEVQAALPSGSLECIQEAVDYLQNVIFKDARDPAEDIPADRSLHEIVRAWFYFPSLSTRQKRNDLVLLAPGYDLTGFVLAGKPGVLCTEGTAQNIQAYIADIKRNSWGDIPSFQKKITERFRESQISQRRFSNMREITDDIERHGQRGNRGDLAQVEQFLQENELGTAFSIVFMQKT